MKFNASEYAGTKSQQLLGGVLLAVITLSWVVVLPVIAIWFVIRLLT